MLATILLALALNLSGAQAGPQPGESGFWKGKIELFQYNFLYSTGVTDSSLVSRQMQLWKLDYDFFANQDGVIREELTHMSRNRGLEGPLDIRLLDYDRNRAVVFDRGGDQEIKGPLAPSGPTQDLGTRRILGFVCEGKEYRWKTFQNTDVDLQRWRAPDSTLKVPLLEVEYLTDATGALLSLRVQVVSEVEPSPPLAPALFQAPTGLKVVDVPSIE